MLWVNSRYLNSAYVGEGLLSFDLYCGRPDWQQEVIAFDCVTGLTGRALADMLQPGVDAQQ